ncbi:MAG: YqaJ viral recombinase family protein [Alitiscatomonas sp.]
MGLNLNYQPEVVVDTSGLTEEQWLGYRRGGIGGSDVAAIMGQSPFCTGRDLYYDKRGIRPVVNEDEDNWVAKAVGHRLEDLVAEIFSRKTGLKVYPIRKMFRHPLYPFMVADVDFFIDFPDGTTGILECKTSNYHCQDKWANDCVPVNYEYQTRHYMATMNLNVVYIACLFGNNENEYVIRRIDRDYDLEEEIINEEAYFWNEYVVKGVEPPYVEGGDLILESIRKHYGPADKDEAEIVLPRSDMAALDQYFTLKDQKSELKKKQDAIEEQMKQLYAGIVERMGIGCKASLKAGNKVYTVTYNPAYRVGISKAGLEKLKIRHPAIYDEYVETTESRRFSAKVKEAA